MRARQLLPAALALAGLLALSACGSGDGLRVEGADTPLPSASTPSASTRGFGPEGTTTTKPTPLAAPTPLKLDLQKVRAALLADKQLDPYARTVLSGCTVVSRCLVGGATVDAMRSGRPQQIVLVHTLENFVIAGFLIAVDPPGLRPVWRLKGQQLKIVPGRNGDLVAESALYSLTDKLCCPSGRLVEVYRWDGRQMAKVSSQDQKGD